MNKILTIDSIRTVLEVLFGGRFHFWEQEIKPCPSNDELERFSFNGVYVRLGEFPYLPTSFSVDLILKNRLPECAQFMATPQTGLNAGQFYCYQARWEDRPDRRVVLVSNLRSNEYWVGTSYADRWLEMVPQISC